MSSLPAGQQSLAGGIFNTVIKLCSAVGLGISTSIYNAESTNSTVALQTTPKPYQMAFWFCVATAGAGLLFVPFLTIGTQGHSVKSTSASSSDEKDSANPALVGGYTGKEPQRDREKPE